MRRLFDSIAIGNLRLPNRIVRSATLRSFAGKDGVVTKTERQVLQELAAREVGLIITGMMGVGRNSCVYPEMIRIDHPLFLDTYRTVADAVHGQGGLLIAQLGHCGAKAAVIDYGDHAFAPSDLELIPGIAAKAMTNGEIFWVVKEFAAAAKRCQQAGADGVQLHAAHGYLISQFLSPCFNKRQDQYGGSLENRARFLFEVYDAVRREVGKDYPVLMKINGSDLVEGGLTEKECVWVCQAMERRGMTAIEVSGGVSLSPASKSTPPGITLQTQGRFYQPAAEIARQVSVPVISVCGYRDPAFIEQALNQSGICAISLSRPLIVQPDLVQQWKRDSQAPSECISCNRCMSDPVRGCPRRAIS